MNEDQDRYIEDCGIWYDNKLKLVECGFSNINNFKKYCHDKIKENYSDGYKIEETGNSIKVYYKSIIKKDDISTLVPDAEFVINEECGHFVLYILGNDWEDAVTGITTFTN